MPTDSNKLQVLANRLPVGELLKEQQRYVFSYRSDVPQDGYVSLTMPVRTRSYEHSKLPPIFEMHLPEGYLLSVLKRHFAKLTGSDDLSMLHLLAGGIRGRLSYQSTGTTEAYTPLELGDLLSPSENLFDELVERFALRSAVSGVQPKVLAQVQDKATLKFEDYIVKTWGDEYPELALNEYWCMKLVQAAGIPVPEFYLSTDARFFIMKRFDIVEDKYLGFEDACVLQAKGRDDKYEGSYEQLAKTILSFVSPQHKSSAMKQYFKMMVLNQWLQNGDAHLKNFGILYENEKNIWLAPAYDVVCTTAYISNDLSALTLLGSRKWWQRKYLLQFAQSHCQLSAAQAVELYDECLQALQLVCEQLKEQLSAGLPAKQTEILKHLLKLMHNHR